MSLYSSDYGIILKNDTFIPIRSFLEINNWLIFNHVVSARIDNAKMAMKTAAQMLDELMGKNRNILPEEQVVIKAWRGQEVTNNIMIR